MLHSAKNILTLLLFFAVAGVFASETYASFNTLLIPFDASVVAQGEIRSSNRYCGVTSNPASLTELTGRRASVTFRQHILDIRGGSMAYGVPVKDKSAFEVAAVYFSVGKYSDLKDEYGNTIDGEINPFAASFSAGWGYRIAKNLTAGARLKYSYESISDNVNTDIHALSMRALTLDGGLRIKKDKGKALWGILIENLGFASVKGDAPSDISLPLTLSSGVSFSPSLSSGTLLSLEIAKLMYDPIEIRTGLLIDCYEGMVLLSGGFRFSIEDVQTLFDRITLNDLNQSSSPFVKTDWSIATLGLGVRTPSGSSRSFGFDGAVEFRIHKMPPAFLLSLFFGM